MTEASYLVKNEKEYDFITKKLDKRGYKWRDDDSLTSSGFVPNLPAFIDTNAFKRVSYQSVNDVIMVSDLMEPDKDVIYMTSDEKAEFDRLKDNYVTLYTALDNVAAGSCLFYRIFGSANKDNQAQLEFARAWVDPSLIVIKDEPRFAYRLKDWVQPILKSTGCEDYIYLGLDGDLSNLHATPQYQTAKEWQSVDNHIKEIFNRVAKK